MSIEVPNAAEESTRGSFWTFNGEPARTVEHLRLLKTKAREVLEKKIPTLFARNQNGRYLFAGQIKLTAWFFSRSPALVWFMVIVIGLIFVIGIPRRLGFQSLAEHRADGTLSPNGIWFEPGWSLMFVGWLPCILALCCTAAHKVPRSLEYLERTAFARQDTSSDGPSLKDFIESRIRTKGKWISWALLLICALLAWLDSQEAFDFQTKSYAARRQAYRYEMTQSLNSFRGWEAANDPKLSIPNLPSPEPPQPNWILKAPSWYLFGIYVLEAVSLFLGLSFVLSFLNFLVAFGGELRPRKDEKSAVTSDFVFRPKLFDPERRLGLGALGSPLDRVVWACVLLQLNVFVLRLDRIARANRQPIYTYPDNLLRIIPNALKSHNTLFHTVYDLCRQALTDVRADEWMFLVLVPFIYLGCIVLPVMQIRRYIRQIRLDEWAEIATKYEDAAIDSPDKAKPLRMKLDAMSNCDSYPNGSVTANRFHWLMIALALGAWLPPLLVCIAAMGIGAAVVTWISSFSPFRALPKPE